MVETVIKMDTSLWLKVIVTRDVLSSRMPHRNIPLSIIMLLHTVIIYRQYLIGATVYNVRIIYIQVNHIVLNIFDIIKLNWVKLL